MPTAQLLLQIAALGFPLLSGAGLLVLAVKIRAHRRASAEREARWLRECLAQMTALRVRPERIRAAESYWAYQARQLGRSLSASPRPTPPQV